MVIGNGLLARTFDHFRENEQVIIFASGVSNSKETDRRQFEKEVTLLHEICQQFPEAYLAYFSTTSINDPSVSSNEYVKHKLAIERYIADSRTSYHIFRLSNVVGTTDNPNTIFNFFSRKIINQEPFTLWKKAYRNLIDAEDVRRICTSIIERCSLMNQVINIAYPENIAVTEIVTIMENHLGLKARYELVDLGDSYNTDVAAIKDYFETRDIAAREYLINLIEKYLKSV